MLEIKSRKLRRILKILIPFVLIPMAAIGGTVIFDEKRDRYEKNGDRFGHDRTFDRRKNDSIL